MNNQNDKGRGRASINQAVCFGTTLGVLTMAIGIMFVNWWSDQNFGRI